MPRQQFKYPKGFFRIVLHNEFEMILTQFKSHGTSPHKGTGKGHNKQSLSQTNTSTQENGKHRKIYKLAADEHLARFQVNSKAVGKLEPDLSDSDSSRGDH